MKVIINVNDYVNVKLTDDGVDEFKAQKHLLPKSDEDGYYKIPLWELMNVTGHVISMGKKMPFDGNLVF